MVAPGGDAADIPRAGAEADHVPGAWEPRAAAGERGGERAAGEGAAAAIHGGVPVRGAGRREGDGVDDGRGGGGADG